MTRAIGAITAACCAGLLMVGCRCGAPGPTATYRPSRLAASSTPSVLATLRAVDQGRPAPPPQGLGLHTSFGFELEYLFGELGGGVAWSVERGDAFEVVHNGRPGKPYAAVGTIALSADGRRSAHGALVDGAWRMVVDGQEGAPFAAVQAPAFSADGAHLSYQAMAGERWHLVVDGTVNEGTLTRYLGQDFSGDGVSIAFITDVDEAGWGRLVVSDRAFKNQVTVHGRARDLQVNADRSVLAAVALAEGMQRVLVLRFDRPAEVVSGPASVAVSSLSFGPQGDSPAYLAERDGRRYLILGSREEPLPPGDLVGPPVVRPGQDAVGYLLATGGVVTFREAFSTAGKGLVAYDEADGLVYRGDGRGAAFAARRGARWFLVVDGKEGPPFDRVVSPAFTPDGRQVVFRARQDGARFVVVADLEGKTVRQYPSYEQVFPVRFTADGRSVAYGVKDGLSLAWKVESL
jgi:hypothetical protein